MRQQRGYCRSWVATLALICALVVGCGGSGAAPVRDQPGNPAVYARIAAMTDCAALQGEFDTAATNHDAAVPGSANALQSTGYMVAADDRMKAVGCYK